MDFPQYRKLSNDRSFYRINSKENFDELQLMGDRVFHHQIKAEKYPEKLKILEMLDCVDEYRVSSFQEWMDLEKRVQ